MITPVAGQVRACIVTDHWLTPKPKVSRMLPSLAVDGTTTMPAKLYTVVFCTPTSSLLMDVFSVSSRASCIATHVSISSVVRCSTVASSSPYEGHTISGKDTFRNTPRMCDMAAIWMHQNQMSAYLGTKLGGNACTLSLHWPDFKLLVNHVLFGFSLVIVINSQIRTEVGKATCRQRSRLEHQALTHRHDFVEQLLPLLISLFLRQCAEILWREQTKSSIKRLFKQMHNEAMWLEW